MWLLNVGQVANLRRIGNPPAGSTHNPDRRIGNPPQLDKLPHNRKVAGVPHSLRR